MAYLKPIPVALVPALPSELLVYLLSNTNVFHTTVIICQSRETFVSSLVKSLQETDAKTTNHGIDITGILQPNLAQAIVSQKIDLLYATNVVELRGLLASFRPPSQEERDKQSLLVVYGLIELHRSTSYWSASGLSSCLGVLVEAGERMQRRVVLFEQKERKVEDVWAEVVPLLGQRNMMGSSAIERSTPSTVLRNVLGRWFQFPSSSPWDAEQQDA